MTAAFLNKRYQLLDPLGTGGMAQVYRARDLMLERFVAIKVLREDYSRDPAFQARFRQEAKAAANLSHPNIVTVHDFGFDQGQLFIVMENVPGTNLKTMIENLGKFSIDDAMPLIVQACMGIGYAHRAGLVHCDVKPHNMLVTPDRRLKVTDFGIARALANIHPEEQNDIVWGSPLYFSPEQAAGQAPSPSSDVYSLGIVLYEMLTGKTPFIAKTAETLADMHRETKPEPPSRINPAITPELEKIILKVLSKEPSARYRTADQLGQVLLTFGKTRQSPALRLTPETTAPVSQPVQPPSIALPKPIATSAPSVTPSRPVTAPPPQRSQPVMQTRRVEPSEPIEQADEAAAEFDWISAGIGLLAFTAWLGLIPFWIYIYLVYNPPIP